MIVLGSVVVRQMKCNELLSGVSDEIRLGFSVEEIQVSGVETDPQLLRVIHHFQKIGGETQRTDCFQGDFYLITSDVFQQRIQSFQPDIMDFLLFPGEFHSFFASAVQDCRLDSEFFKEIQFPFPCFILSGSQCRVRVGEIDTGEKEMPLFHGDAVRLRKMPEFCSCVFLSPGILLPGKEDTAVFKGNFRIMKPRFFQTQNHFFRGILHKHGGPHGYFGRILCRHFSLISLCFPCFLFFGSGIIRT